MTIWVIMAIGVIAALLGLGSEKVERQEKAKMKQKKYDYDYDLVFYESTPFIDVR